MTGSKTGVFILIVYGLVILKRVITLNSRYFQTSVVFILFFILFNVLFLQDVIKFLDYCNPSINISKLDYGFNCSKTSYTQPGRVSNIKVLLKRATFSYQNFTPMFDYKSSTYDYSRDDSVKFRIKYLVNALTEIVPNLLLLGNGPTGARQRWYDGGISILLAHGGIFGLFTLTLYLIIIYKKSKKYCGCNNSKRIQHTALVDCELLTKVYINLIDQKEPTLNFQNQDNNKIDLKLTNNLYCRRVVKPTSEEIQLHNNYLKTNLKKNFFN